MAFEFYILGESQIYSLRKKCFLNFLGKCAFGLTVRKALVPTAAKSRETLQLLFILGLFLCKYHTTV